MVLYRLPLNELGQLADQRRQMAKAGAFEGRGIEIVTYIVDRNINYTNVCNVYCKFCAFYRTERDADHYVLSHEDIDRKIDELDMVAEYPAQRRPTPVVSSRVGLEVGERRRCRAGIQSDQRSAQERRRLDRAGRFQDGRGHIDVARGQ